LEVSKCDRRNKISEGFGYGGGSGCCMNIREMKLADLPAIARVNVDSFRASHEGIVSEEFIGALSYSFAEERFIRMLEKSERQSTIFVAEHEKKVVGYAMAGLAREEVKGFEGELYGIYINPDHQRKGIGKRLVRAVVNHLKNKGVNSLFVWVFKKNYPARKFYTDIGGEIIQDRNLKLGEELVGEVAYGWSDIQILI
jgi:ribosomal protein S18 acetylase RimI-like enzyme